MPTYRLDKAVAPERRTVQFSPRVHYRRIPPYFDYSNEEHDATWYNAHELEQIVTECITTCRMMMAGDLVLEDEGFCSRGLEYKTSSGQKFRHEKRAEAWAIVMEECAMQKKLGVQEPEYLGMIYGVATKDMRRIAHLTGLRDQEVAYPALRQSQSQQEIHPILRNKQMHRTKSQEPVSDADSSDSSLSIDPTVFLQPEI